MNRTLDIALTLPLALLALPVVGLAAVWIKFSSSGPVIFSQVRVGRHEVPFRCHKLRTMYQDTETLPTHELDNTVVTRPGRLLRKMKLDELPQLWNVLKGEMSLVGPRPCLPIQQELIGYRREFGVYQVRPGVTGLAQIRGIDMSNPLRCAEVDWEYLRTRSLKLDSKILAATVTGGVL